MLFWTSTAAAKQRGAIRCGIRRQCTCDPMRTRSPMTSCTSTSVSAYHCLRVGIFMVILAVAIARAEDAHAFSTSRPARILYIGDSLAANTAAEVVRHTSGSTTVAVTSHSTFPGMAICDFLEHPAATMHRRDRLRARVRSARPDLVIMQFWGNSFTECMLEAPFNTAAYYRRYFLDADAAVREIESTAHDIGINRPRILWVLQGPEPDVPARTPLLNQIYRWIAAAHGDRTSDAGWTLSMAANPSITDADARAKWTQYLPCNDDERGTPFCTHPDLDGGVAQLHLDDDPIHFCLGNHKYFFHCDAPSPASRRYGMRIARDARAWLGLH